MLIPFSLPHDRDTLKSEATFLIQKLFNLQETYYKQFNESIKLNKNLKELLLKYNEKYRIINKKAHRLNEKSESINIRTNLATFVNREEGQRVNYALQNNKNNEMAIFKNIFKLNYNESDIFRFASEKESLNGNFNLLNSILEQSDKGLLLKVFKKISKNKVTPNLLNKNDTMNFVNIICLTDRIF